MKVRDVLIGYIRNHYAGSAAEFERRVRTDAAFFDLLPSDVRAAAMLAGWRQMDFQSMPPPTTDDISLGSLSGQSLPALIQHDDWRIRLQVATHPRTPSAYRWSLMHDSDSRVRRAAALPFLHDPLMPTEILVEFVRDTQGDIALAATLVLVDRNSSALPSIARDPLTHPQALTWLAQLAAKGEVNLMTESSVAPPHSEKEQADARWKVLLALDLRGNLPEDGNAAVTHEEMRALAEYKGTNRQALMALAHSRRAELRHTVALNPATPPFVLARLLSDEVADVRRAAILTLISQDGLPKELQELAENEQTGGDVLTLLADSGNWNIKVAVAANPRTPPSVLCTLIRADGDEVTDRQHAVLAWLALNNSAATPELVLEMVDDPALPVGTLERCVRLQDPQVVTRALGRLLAWEGRSEQDPPEGEEDEWRSSTSWEERLAYARSYAFPTVDELTELAQDDDQDVVAAALAHPLMLASDMAMAAEALELLADNGDWLVRECVAHHPSTPRSVLHQLLEDSEEPVQLAALSTVAKHMTASVAVAQDEETEPEVLEELAGSQAWEVRLAVAGNSSTPPDVLTAFLNDASEDWTDVRIAWAAVTNPAFPRTDLLNAIHDGTCSVGVLERFARHGDTALVVAAVRQLLTWEGRNIDTAGLEEWRESEDWQDRLLYARTYEKVFRLDLLELLEEDADDDVQSALLAHPLILAYEPGTPVAVLELLARHTGWEVRLGVAGNPSTPPDILMAFLQDASEDWDDVQAGWAAVMNPALPRAELLNAVKGGTCSLGVLERLARHEDMALVVAAVRQLLTWEERNPDISNLKKWRESEDWQDRLLYARTHGEIPRQNLLALLEKEADEDVRAALLAHPLILAYDPATPVAVLELLARHEDWEVRMGVAGHPLTPLALRQRLSNDEDEDVRKASIAAEEVEEVTAEEPERELTVQEQGSQGEGMVLRLSGAVWREQSVDCEIEYSYPGQAPRYVQLKLPIPSEQRPGSTAAVVQDDGVQVTLQPAVDGRALCAEIRLTRTPFLALWAVCRNADGEIAPLVYPLAPEGEVPVRDGQTTLLMFDVQGRHHESWFIELQGRRQLGTTVWSGDGMLGADKSAWTDQGSGQELRNLPVVSSNELERLLGGRWPAALPRPQVALEPILLHILQHQPMPLGDLNAWMERQGLARSVRRELSRYLDEVTDAGLPFIVRNEAYQPPRLEVDTAVLAALTAYKS